MYYVCNLNIYYKYLPPPKKKYIYIYASVLLLLSRCHVFLLATLWTAAHLASLSHCLPEFAQMHIHWVGDAIQPSHSLLSPSVPALSISQHQGLFQWVSSLHQVGKILELSFSTCLPINAQGWFSLGLTGFISLLPKGLSRVFSSTTVYRHQFFGFQTSLWSNSHIYTWLLGKSKALTRQTFVGKVISLLF